MGALFYRLNRHFVGDISFSRWIQIVLLVPAVIALIGRPNGYWLIAGVLFALFIAFIVASYRWRQRNYVQFQRQEKPEIAPQPLTPADKLPIFASGLFSVEGKYADFTWLQVFPHFRHTRTCRDLPGAAQSIRAAGQLGRKRDRHVVHLFQR
ncbi:MAG: hypothetical protein R2856_04160 [Caldilineaceae bacterium]